MRKINRMYIYSLLFLAFIIHLTVLTRVRIFRAEPDIMLSCVLFFGLFLGPRFGLETGIAAGLLKDIYSFDIFGTNTFVFALTGLLAGAVRGKFFRESKITQALLVFIFSMFAMITHFIIAMLLTRRLSVSMAEYIFSSAIPSSVYTSAVSVPIFLNLINVFGLKEDSGYL